MRKYAFIVISLLALSAAAQAQTKDPVYLVAQFEVTDAAGFKKFAEATSPLVKAHEGVFLSRMNIVYPGLGEPPKSAVIISFPSLDQARAYVTSAEYRALAPQREQATAKFHSFMLQGGDLSKSN